MHKLLLLLHLNSFMRNQWTEIFHICGDTQSFTVKHPHFPLYWIISPLLKQSWVEHQWFSFAVNYPKRFSLSMKPIQPIRQAAITQLAILQCMCECSMRI